MNYYEKAINTFLAGVASNMSAVYLPAFFVSLIQLLEDYYKFDIMLDSLDIQLQNTRLNISYQIATAYFLSYLYGIRRQVPFIKFAPSRGMTHDERLCSMGLDITDFTTAKELRNHPSFIKNSKRIIRDMKDAQNILSVFERRCSILRCNINYIEMDIAAVDALMNNSILYSRMGELICYQYLTKLRHNNGITSQLEACFLRGGTRADFGNIARAYVMEFQQGKCYYCGHRLDDNNDHKPRADHFIPWVFVRNSLPENLVYACNNCNSNKSDRLPGISIFNKLLQRNAPGSEFWTHYPEGIPNIEQRIERWVRNYYQASEQLATGWIPA